jgi:hypothetical protein
MTRASEMTGPSRVCDPGRRQNETAVSFLSSKSKSGPIGDGRHATRSFFCSRPENPPALIPIRVEHQLDVHRPDVPDVTPVRTLRHHRLAKAGNARYATRETTSVSSGLTGYQLPKGNKMNMPSFTAEAALHRLYENHPVGHCELAHRCPSCRATGPTGTGYLRSLYLRCLHSQDQLRRLRRWRLRLLGRILSTPSVLPGVDLGRRPCHYTTSGCPPGHDIRP